MLNQPLFIILSSRSTKNLAEHVNNLLIHNYTPTGSIAISSSDNSPTMFYQAMILTPETN